MITKALSALLRGYNRYISPHQALATHGLCKGLLLTVWRLLRCQPFAKFGYDPVPEKGRWVNPERRLTKSK